MTTRVKLLANPLIISCILYFSLLSCGFIVLKNRQSYKSLLSITDSNHYEFEITSSPTVINSGAYYSTICNLKRIVTSSNKSIISSDSKGKVNVLIPVDLVDCLDTYLDFGIRLTADGYWSDFYDSIVLDNIYEAYYERDIIHSILYFRSYFRNLLRVFFLNWGNAGGLLIALFTGSRRYLSQDFIDLFRLSGCSHILALSGMHLSFITLVPKYLFNKIFGRKTGDIAAIVFATLFMLFVGFSPSLVRAYLMLVLYLIFNLFKINIKDNLSLLCSAMMIHIIIVPSDILSISFKLSYSALAGIIIISPLIENIITKYFSASMGAFIFTSPITIKVFGVVYPIGIISSALVGPIILIFMILGIFGFVLCSFIPFLGGAFSYFINVIYFILISVISFFSKAIPINF